MLICMRTTLDLDDALLRSVKARAAETGRTMTSFIEEALRDHLVRISGDAPTQPLRWVVVPGGPRAGVDLADRDALLDAMEERR
jgi:hypothetical protein